MKTYLDCISCFFDQALRAGRVVADDDRLIKHLLDKLGAILESTDLESTPPETGRLIYRAVKEVTGNSDPFHRLKSESTQHAHALYPSLKKIIDESNDSLLTVIRVAIAGNVIDYGVSSSFDANKTVERWSKRALPSAITHASKIVWPEQNRFSTLVTMLTRPSLTALSLNR